MGKGLSALLVVLALIIISQSVSAVYSWDIDTSLGRATAWSNHKYLARSPDNSTLYGVFTNGINIHFTKSTNEGVDWSAPIILSTLNLGGEPQQSVDPSIIVDSSNVIHVVWWDDYYMQTKNSEIFYRSCNAAAVDCTNINSWSAITNLPDNTGKDILPVMVIDSANVKHLVWAENLSNEIYYSKCSANCGNPAGWSSALNISNTAYDSWQPSIVVTSDRNVGIVWEQVTGPEDDNGTPPQDIYYKTCASATADCSNAANWSSAVNVSNDANVSLSARVIVDSANRTHLVWSGVGNTGNWLGSYTLYKGCNGACGEQANWKNLALVSDLNAEELNEEAFVTVDSSNKLHVFWLESTGTNIWNMVGNIRYRTRDSAGNWNGITELTNGRDIGYLGISCNYTDFNPSLSYERLDCVWTNQANNKLVYFAITKDPVTVNVPASQGTIIPTNTYLTINPTNLSGAAPGAYTITVTEFSIYSPYTFGAGTLLPWYYMINSTLTNYTFTIRLAISYLDRDNDGFEDITGRAENTLAVAYWDNGTWQTLSGSVNTTQNYVLITTNHFSDFSLVSLDEPPSPITAVLDVTPKKKNIKANAGFDFVVHLSSEEDLSSFEGITEGAFSNLGINILSSTYDSETNELSLKVKVAGIAVGAYEFQLLELGGRVFSTNSDSAEVFMPAPVKPKARNK